MECFEKDDMLEKLCKVSKQYGMFIEFDRALLMCCKERSFDDSIKELYRAAPYLEKKECKHIIPSGSGFFLFENEDELNEYYNQTVGYDGPTELNKYDGYFRVYAYAVNPNGEVYKENT